MRKTLLLVLSVALIMISANSGSILGSSPVMADAVTTSPGDKASGKERPSIYSTTCPTKPNLDYEQGSNFHQKSCPDARIDPVEPGGPSVTPEAVFDPEAMINRTEIQEPDASGADDGLTPLPEEPVYPTEEDR